MDADAIAAAAHTATVAGQLYGAALDYSEASVDVLAQLLTRIAGEPMDDQQREHAVRIFASYLLETARRALGGRFEWSEDWRAPVLVVGEPVCRLGLHAFGKVRGRLGGDDGDNVAYVYREFAARARRATPGDNAIYL